MGKADPQDSLLRGGAVAATGVLWPSLAPLLLGEGVSLEGRLQAWVGGVCPQGNTGKGAKSMKKVGGEYQNWLPSGRTS